MNRIDEPIEGKWITFLLESNNLSTEGTGIVNFDPVPDAFAMEDMTAIQLNSLVVLHELLQANRTHVFAVPKLKRLFQPTQVLGLLVHRVHEARQNVIFSSEDHHGRFIPLPPFQAVFYFQEENCEDVPNCINSRNHSQAVVEHNSDVAISIHRAFALLFRGTAFDYECAATRIGV